MSQSSGASDHDTLVISYLTLRKSIGFLGLLLPFILWLGEYVLEGSLDVKPSISDYYHSSMRDVFVGTMCGVALFLFAYKGHDPIDRKAGYMGCLFALGVVFFPTEPMEGPSVLPPYIGKIHFLFATLFFGVLIFFSLFLFTRHKRVMTEMKKVRNTVYHICAYIMIGCIFLIALYFLWLEHRYPSLARWDPVFYLESIALIAFGVSWLVKGELILKDLGQSGADSGNG